MRIIFITSSTNKSGGSRQALYLAQQLHARGHTLTFFTKTHAALRELDPTMSWGDLPADKRQWRAAVEALLPPAKGQSTPPTIVHAFHNKAVKKIAWWGLIWHRRNVVCVGHRGVIYRPGNPLPYISPGISTFVVNSRACAKVLRPYGVSPSRVHVVYNGIPPGRILPTQTADQAVRDLPMLLHQDEVVYSTIAGDNPIKGVEILLRSYAEANLSHAKLLIMGVTPEKWRPLCIELGIERSVALMGKTENVADYLQLAHAFVLPSLTESMPNTLLEAICMGLPVIASTVGGVPELVDGNGILVPPNDVHALAQALNKMHHTPQQRAHWAQVSEKIAPHYSLEHRGQIIEAIYRDQLHARGLPTG